MRTDRLYKNKNNSIFGLTCIIVCATILFSCKKKDAENSNKIPTISYMLMSENTVKAASDQILLINFSFADGDGDLGNAPSSGNYDIYTIDNRDTSKINYFFPQRLPTVVDPNFGISGDCTLGVDAGFILLRPTRPTVDTVRYEIYIKDRAGNESNHITTPNIYIVP